MSADQFDRRVFTKAAGGVAASAAVSTHLDRPDPAAAASVTSSGPASRNPFLTDSYPADPDAFAFVGRLYADTDRDQAPLGATDFVMTDWRVYSTADTVNWTDHGVWMSPADFPWTNRNAWPPQQIHRDGVSNADFGGEVEDLRDTRHLPDALATELAQWAVLIVSNITASTA